MGLSITLRAAHCVQNKLLKVKGSAYHIACIIVFAKHVPKVKGST